MTKEMDFGATSNIKEILVANTLIVAGWISAGFTTEYPVLGPLVATLCLSIIGIQLFVARFVKGIHDGGRMFYGFESPGSHIRLRYYHLFPFFLFLPNKLATISRDFAKFKYSIEINRKRNMEKVDFLAKEVLRLHELHRTSEDEITSLKTQNTQMERENIDLKKALDISNYKASKMEAAYRQFVIDGMCLSIDQGVNAGAYQVLANREGAPFSALEWYQIISDCRKSRLKHSVFTILHADDCSDEREALRYYIDKINRENGWHFHLIQANDGVSALEMFTLKHPDFIITDQMMGSDDKDGNTLARKIREISPTIPIIVRSGSTQEELSELFSGLSVEFVPKGTHYPKFVDAIELAAEKVSWLAQENNG